MKRWPYILSLLGLSIAAATASEVEIVCSWFSVHSADLTFDFQNQEKENQQRCSGMYSRKSWGGAVEPYILTKFIKVAPEGDADPIVSLLIFEWKDEELIGRYLNKDAQKVGKHD